MIKTKSRLAWLAVLTVWAVILLLDFNARSNITSRRGGQQLLRKQQNTTRTPTNHDHTANTNRRHQKHHTNDHYDPDGYFNNLPVYYKKFNEQFHSNAHCIGENFVDSKQRNSNSAWKYRSCKFQNLCFDMVDREFVLFLSKEQKALENALMKVGRHQFWPASSSMNGNTAVAVGGVHPRWGGNDIVLKWYPKFRNIPNDHDDDDNGGYYMLPSDHVFVPWNSFHGFNPGHIITDDFLPIYTLLSYFNLTDKELAMIHIDLPNNNSTRRWDNCQNHWKLCKPYMERFLPLIGTELRKTSTQFTATLDSIPSSSTTTTTMTRKEKTRYVCAAHGVAGMGMLTDHGKKMHGNFEKDFLWTHNIGRGDAFYRFRNWMVGRLLSPGENNGRATDDAVDVEKRDLSRPPYRIVVSNNSSTDARRNISFEEHAAALRRKLGKKYELDIRGVELSDMSVADQVKLAAGASMLVTAAGGGASIGHFLPRGASMFLFFAEFPPDKEVSTGQYNGWVMDWDTYNNFAYIRTHWLPIRHGGNATESDDGTSQREADMNVFVKLVDQELDLISHVNDYD